MLRPLYARGNKNATSCPVNMADITTAEECRAAADLLGVTFMEEGSCGTRERGDLG